MSNELAKIEQLPITSLADLYKTGTALAQSGMFGVKTDQQGFVVAATCFQERISLLEFLETYHIVEGRPSMRADAMLSRLLELGGSYKIIERTSERACILAKFRDAEAEFSFTWEDAQLEPFVKDRSGGIKKNWGSPRARMQMLWARVVSDSVRTVCPMANRGTYSPEEIRDFSENENSATARTDLDIDVEPIEAEPVGIDYSICPIGGSNVAGHVWDWFPLDQLEFALPHKDLQAPEYQEQIKAAITKRKATGETA